MNHSEEETLQKLINISKKNVKEAEDALNIQKTLLDALLIKAKKEYEHKQQPIKQIWR